MDDLNLYEKHLTSDNNCKTVKSSPHKILQGMTNNVGFTFGVGDTTLHFTISIGKDDYNW